MMAGGIAVDFPVVSIHESFSAPTSMFLRNLMAMDTEELVRAQPMDAVVLIGGCDKTVPALLMGFVVLRILIDIAGDPTSHNLWPFELVRVAVLSLVFIGVLLAVRKLSGEKA